MTPAELGDLRDHGDPDAVIAAMLAGRWRLEVRPDGRAVAILLPAPDTAPDVPPEADDDRCTWCGYQLGGYAAGCDTCGACIEAGRTCRCGLPADPDRCYHGVCHGRCCTDDPHPCGYCLDEAATP